MSDIRDFREFRNIADEVMNDINVTDEMKNEVLRRCGERRNARMPVLRVAVVAACGALILGVLHFTGALKPILPDQQAQPYDNRQPGIFSAQDDQESTQGQSDISIMNEPFEEWQPDSLGEAGRSFGKGFLTPSYIPQGYEMINIHVSGTDMGKADRIVINYSDGERFFSITEQKNEDTGDFSGFETVDINGNSGHVISDTVGTAIFTQLYWTDSGIMYTISGEMPKEEAILTARSMKPAMQK